MVGVDVLNEITLVRKLRETIRRFWGLEVGFADRRGYVASHAQGIAVPPPNDFCRASLSHVEGFQRCNRSVEEATAQLESETRVHLGSDLPGGPKPLVTDSRSGAARPPPLKPTGLYGKIGYPRRVRNCHLGFPLLMMPVADATKFYGALFTGGFRVEGDEGETSALVERGARQLRLPVDDMAGAWHGVPTLSEDELDRLGFLLDLCAEEVLGAVRTQVEVGGFGDLIGSSERMQQLYGLLERIARSDATILIIGENGTGKEVIARTIHQKGPRRNKPFVACNCGALSENLLESELFGHVKGSFTGAIGDKKGLFLAADTGTLFLDEIGDTSPAMQVKLLRVLQEGTFTPVGATKPTTVDVRVIAATNRPLARMVEEGSFREDLFYRLNVIGLDVPPLRDRKSDLPALVAHFLAAHPMRGSDGQAKRLGEQVMQYFYDYDWPGNVRQLENEIERLIVLSGDTPEIGPSFLSPAVLAHMRGSSADIPTKGTFQEVRENSERVAILQALVRTGWNRSRVARELQMSRTTLHKKIRDYRLGEGHS